MTKKKEPEKRGPGRPKQEPTVPICIRLTVTQHAQYIEMGGARWLKRLMDEDITERTKREGK